MISLDIGRYITGDINQKPRLDSGTTNKWIFLLLKYNCTTINAMFKHFQSTSGEAAMEKYDQEDNILSPRTSEISAAFDLPGKVLYCNKNKTWLQCNVGNISSLLPSTCRWTWCLGGKTSRTTWPVSCSSRSRDRPDWRLLWGPSPAAVTWTWRSWRRKRRKTSMR